MLTFSSLYGSDICLAKCENEGVWQICVNPFEQPVIRRHLCLKRANQFRLLQAPVHQDRLRFVPHELLLSEVESERSSLTDGGMERTDEKNRIKVGSVDADWVVATGSATAKGLPVMVFEVTTGHFEMPVGTEVTQGHFEMHEAP